MRKKMQISFVLTVLLSAVVLLMGVPVGVAQEPTPEQRDEFWSKGDVNRNGYIDTLDLDIIQDEFNWEGPPGENPADINSDGKVDLLDLGICADNQGLDIWTYFGLIQVGGVMVPIDKLGLLAPYIGLAVIMVGTVATVAYVNRVKRRKEKQ